MNKHDNLSQTEEDSIIERLNALKAPLLSSLTDNTHLSSLHRMLDMKSKSWKTLRTLYDYHPSSNINFELKEKRATTVSEWYADYLTIQPCLNSQEERRDRDYPLAVLLPVVIDLIIPKDPITIESPQPEQEEMKSTPLNNLMFPKWEGQYDNKLHINTCTLR